MVVITVDAFAEITVKWHSPYQLVRYASTPQVWAFGSRSAILKDRKRRSSRIRKGDISESAGKNPGWISRFRVISRQFIVVSISRLLSTRDRSASVRGRKQIFQELAHRSFNARQRSEGQWTTGLYGVSRYYIAVLNDDFIRRNMGQYCPKIIFISRNSFWTSRS